MWTFCWSVCLCVCLCPAIYKSLIPVSPVSRVDLINLYNVPISKYTKISSIFECHAHNIPAQTIYFCRNESVMAVEAVTDEDFDDIATIAIYRSYELVSFLYLWLVLEV